MLRRLVPAVAAIAGLALAWALAWPAQFGGRAHWLVVQGSDLEPYYAEGDLVIAHERTQYAQGSLVATDGTDGTDGPVLGLAGEAATDVLGAPWLHLRGAGDLLMNAAGVIVSWPFLLAVVLASLITLSLRRRQLDPGSAQPQPTADEASHTLAS